ncbi:signal peptidase II [Thermoanaerobacterium sp. DL9XJH110]|uniref:signal peptidase II n=1 Tax=Thermoanaerobacterium sp. DL9XJH110 TaxID=3386643 RepID=UPI003BB52E48
MDLILYSLIILAADQLSKFLIRSTLRPHQSIPIITDVFHITYVQNTGAAFSILRGKTYFFTMVSILIILMIVYYAKKIPAGKKLLRFTLALICGGAAGNLVDRLRYGYVVDFLDFRVWPVFNIADSAIVAGVLILAYLIAFDAEIQGLLNKDGR